MVGARRAGEVRFVAGVAGRRCEVVVVVGVARCAGDSRVRARQRIVGIDGVIEIGIEPICVVVAGVASVREVCCHVVGIRGAREIRGVAAIAILRHRCVVVVFVA